MFSRIKAALVTNDAQFGSVVLLTLLNLFALLSGNREIHIPIVVVVVLFWPVLVFIFNLISPIRKE